MDRKYRVLIVDDSAFIRQFLTEILNRSAELEVVATASDPTKAVELLKVKEFDVITLDIEMPNMDGLAFLSYLMRSNPKPVVVISVWTQKNSNAAVKALSLGAVDVIAKPSIGYKEGMSILEVEIIDKVVAAAKAKVVRTVIMDHPPLKTELNKTTAVGGADRIIAIGASTGGTVAVGQIFKNLNPDIPGVLIIQHMPAIFTAAFAKTLDESSRLRVKEAENGEELSKGTALVVPGGRSLALKKTGSKYIVKVGPPVISSVYNPSIDFTLLSIAAEVGSNAMGVILTGMGDDGARGLKAMYESGAYTVAQDEKSSVVYGMPHKALEFGGVRKVLALDEVARAINKWASTY